MAKFILTWVSGVLIAAGSYAGLLVNFSAGNDWVAANADCPGLSGGAVAFTTNRLSPAGFTGPEFFGGAGGTVSLSGWRVVNSTPDYLYASISATPGAQVWALYLFSHPSASITQVVYDARITGTSANQAVNARIVVRKTDGSYYISQVKSKPSYFTEHSPAALVWYHYNPAAGLTAVGSQIADFQLNDINASGQLITAENTTPDLTFTMAAATRSFQVLGEAGSSLIEGGDADADGLPDSWELLHFGGNVDPEAVCANGFSTMRDAYIAGFNPTDPQAAFRVSFVSPDVLVWNAVSGRFYSVYAATNLLTAFRPQVINLIWPQNGFTNPASAASGFYRIFARIDPEPPTYYLDPVNGSLANSGTAESPWPGLRAVIDAGMIQSKRKDGTLRNPSGAIADGARLWLRSGYHGDVRLTGYFQDKGITAEAEPGQAPKIGSIQIQGGACWTFSGLDISPSYRPGGLPTYAVSMENSETHGTISFITVQNCLISSTNDTSGWISTNDWISLTCGGLRFSGSDNRAVSNIIRNVSMGISLSGERDYAGYNLIENFRVDGLRTLNHYCTAEYNTIRNAYQVDANHMDGIQGFSHLGAGNELQGIVLRGNTILRHQNPSALFASPYLQGIGFFDGPFTNCVFENNLVMAYGSHGISVYNATGCRIINNTSVGDGTLGASGQIYLGYKTNITGNVENNVLRNNLADAISADPVAVNTVLSGNLLFSAGVTRQQVFVDASNRDFRLRSSSPAIDAGSSVDAPAADIVRIKRPQGAGVDIGAYESVQP